MGVSIKYAGEKRRNAALRRAIWDKLERKLDQRLDSGAVYEITEQLCKMVDIAADDMMNVAEFDRIGIGRKHHYKLELYISEDRIASQNTLEGAGSLPPHPPARAQLWLAFMKMVFLWMCHTRK